MAGVILVLGPERFLARQAVKRVVSQHEDLEFTRLRGGDIQVAQALDDLRTPTLLGKPRGVVVEEAGPLFEGESLAALASYAEKPVKGALLVLQAPSLDRRFKDSKRLAAKAEIVDCQPLQAKHVEGWLAQRTRAHGLQVAGDALDALRDRIGDDLGELDAALARLGEQIAPRRRLTAADVTGSTEDHRSPLLFEAANALEERDLPRALEAVAGAFAEGLRIRQDVVSEAAGIALILLANLHGAYCKLIRFHMLRQAGLGEAEAARRTGIQTWRARAIARHNLATLVARHRHFVAADRALKGAESGFARRVMERLLVSLLA